MPRIQQEVEKLRLERGDDPDGQSDDRILADLRKVPLCPDTPALQSKREPRPEMQALYEVQTYLRSNGLIFDDPTLNAFHTNVANYAGEHGPEIEQALADQVETRILSKLDHGLPTSRSHILVAPMRGAWDTRRPFLADCINKVAKPRIARRFIEFASRYAVFVECYFAKFV